MNPANSSFAAIVLAAALLPACGGSGGSGGTGSTGTSAPAATVSSAQGVYQGPVSNGRTHNTIVLENGQFYALYGTATTGGLLVSGFMQGTGTSNNGSFSSTNVRDFFLSGAVFTGSLTATYNLGKNFDGSITEGSSTVTFTGGPIPNSPYNYNLAANLANIVGGWTLTGLQGDVISLSISSSGTFSASSAGCTFTGSIQPRASGKNVFDLALTFGSSPCRLAGQSANGIGLEYLLANGKRQLVIAGADSARANGTAAFGVR
jgi:hypothetical protein